MKTTALSWISLFVVMAATELTTADDCGGPLTQQSGVITSPGYPDVYPNNKRCLWYLMATGSEVIDLRFSRLDLEGVASNQTWIASTCPDYVRVYDGDTINTPLLINLCRIYTPAQLAATIIRSSSNKMLVEFFSDYDGQRPGFVANFWSHVCPEFTYGSIECNQTCSCVRDKTSYCNSTNGVCVCKPGWTGADCSQDLDECANRTVETCPIDYQECVNTVGSFTCPCQPGLRANTKGTCEVDPMSQCSAGHGCSHLCAKVQGQDRCYCPDSMKLVGKTCQACDKLKFGKECRLNCSCNYQNTNSCSATTGGCVCSQGWTSTDCSTDINECYQLQVKVCTGSGQTCRNTPGGYECVTCADGNETLSASSGIIQSPNFPKTCFNLTYTWTVKAGRPGALISFNLTQMEQNYHAWDTSSSFDCQFYGGLFVYDGSSADDFLLAKYCYYLRNTPTIWSTSGTLHFVFRTYRDQNQIAFFQGIYSVTDYTVGSWRLTAPSGNIVSPGYPDLHSNMVSFWTISVANYSTITLRFANKSVTDDCVSGNLRLFDRGQGVNSQARCSLASLGSFAILRNPMYIMFQTSSNNPVRGFNASYITCNCTYLNTLSCQAQGGACICKSGFNGTQCEFDINECLTQPCPEHSQCVNDYGSFRCFCWNGTQVNTNGSCPDWHQDLRNQTGRFFSQNYPLTYPNYINYTWNIFWKQGTVVSLRFSDFYLQESYKCYMDFLSIYDGADGGKQLIGQYCGSNVPGLLRTTSDKMTILLQTNYYNNGVERGFNATYYSHDCPLFTYGENECTIPCACDYDNTRLCDNINGVCFCNPGWGGRGCSQDVDECRNSTACPINSDCINEPGTYRCECRPGYQNVSGQCQAVSSCRSVQCSHLCAINTTTGKEQCYCPQDMMLAIDGTTCLVSLYPFGIDAGDNQINGKTKTKLFSLPVSNPIQFSSDVPVGKSVQSVAYVQTNGVVIFGEGELPANPNGKVVYIGQQSLAAPLWIDNKNGIGSVYYHLYENCNSSLFSEPGNQFASSPKAREVTERASRDVQRFYGITGFTVEVVLLATWKDVQPKSCQGKDTNTFQIVFVSGYVSQTYPAQAPAMSFVFFIYQEGNTICLPGQPFSVGVSTDKGVFGQEFSPSNKTNSITTGGIAYQGILPYLVGGTLTASHLCQRYVCNHSDLISSPYFQAEVNQLFQCPCSMDKLSLQWQLVKEDKTTRCYSISAVAKRRLLLNNQRNIMCCYLWTAPKTNSSADQLKAWQAGSFIPPAYYLISDPWQASSDSTSLNPFAYRDALENINAQTWCCKKSAQKYCDRFYKVFHNLTCTPYPVFFYASAIGDPTMQTLDGFSYPMNYMGEVEMLRADTFTLQARTSTVMINGTVSKGTVFVAFAAKESNYSRFQVHLSATNTTMVILAQGMDYTNKFYSDVNFDMSDDSLSVRRLTENNKVVVAASFPCGVGVKIQVGERSLQIELEVSTLLQNKTRGLLGNFNNNPHDDFILSNGTILSINMTERQILNQFVKSYLVTNATTAFIYNKGESTNDYQKPGFVPLFLDETAPATLNEAKTFCGVNETACQYDYVAMGPSFARMTKDAKAAIDSKIKKFVNKSPTIKLVMNLNKNMWQVTQGRKSVLQLQAADGDSDPVSYELVENFTDVAVSQTGYLSYTPSLDPVNIKVRSYDSKGAYSPVLQIIPVVCPICNNQGTCNPTSIEQEFLEGNFKILKCNCSAAYTGSRCERELDACLLNPCSQGQNCTDLTAAQQGSSHVGYRCGPCPRGTVDVNGSCADVNECLNTSLCQQECLNTYTSYQCYCRPGFRLNPQVQRTCTDINECEERTSQCQQQCINTPGNYTCACSTGYTLAVNGRDCILNASNAVLCQKCQQVCQVNNNQTSCGCNIGFRIDQNDPNRCVDIDECNNGVNSPCNQKCTNTVGKFSCSCFPGYSLDSDKTTCIECEYPRYGENCSSTCNCLGRGVCDKVRGCLCDSNWTGPSCDKDVNECSNSSVCASGLVCQNEPGSFSCVCQQGYELKNGTCTDVNECADYNNRCDLKVEVCVNNVGNYSCQCKEGYTRNSLTNLCQDINECLQRTDSCEHLCENGPGSYRCICPEGYKLAADQHRCEKYKNVCNLNCSHGCSLDDNGQPVCICPRGYLKVGNNSCQDINECASLETNLCSEKDLCQNLAGDYRCSCLPGSKLQNDQRTCVACSGGTWGIECNRSCSCSSKGTIRCDPVTGCVCKPGSTGELCTGTINRCATGELTCQANEECVVSGGNSVCQCRKGFVYDGNSCNDENECQNARLHNCPQNCTNTVGSFKCSCYSGYTYNNSTNTCQDINECEQGNNCSQTCVNTDGSYRCSCRTGQFLQADGVSCGACQNGCSTTCDCVEANTASCNTTTGQCVCKPGWTSANCSVDVNECLANPCPDYRRCRNLNGSFECVCWNGLQISSNGTCPDCNRTLTDQTGYLMTSNYPHFYDSNSFCSWKIVSNMSGANIVLSFLDYKAEGCPYDFVTLYDGPTIQSPVIKQVCDNLLGPFASTGNSMLVVFTSDASVTDRGFRASFNAVLPCKYKSCSHTCQVVSSNPWTEQCTCPEWMKLDPANDRRCIEINACGSVISEPEGYIVSANYPDMYPINFNCHWTIQGRKNSVIVFSFLDFNIEETDGCEYDWVRFSDGSSAQSPALGQFCGKTLPPNITSSGNILYIEFNSDESVTDWGFKGKYVIRG